MPFFQKQLVEVRLVDISKSDPDTANTVVAEDGSLCYEEYVDPKLYARGIIPPDSKSCEAYIVPHEGSAFAVEVLLKAGFKFHAAKYIRLKVTFEDGFCSTMTISKRSILKTLSRAGPYPTNHSKGLVGNYSFRMARIWVRVDGMKVYKRLSFARLGIDEGLDDETNVFGVDHNNVGNLRVAVQRLNQKRAKLPKPKKAGRLPSPIVRKPSTLTSDQGCFGHKQSLGSFDVKDDSDKLAEQQLHLEASQARNQEIHQGHNNVASNDPVTHSQTVVSNGQPSSYETTITHVARDVYKNGLKTHTIRFLDEEQQTESGTEVDFATGFIKPDPQGSSLPDKQSSQAMIKQENDLHFTGISPTHSLNTQQVLASNNAETIRQPPPQTPQPVAPSEPVKYVSLEGEAGKPLVVVFKYRMMDALERLGIKRQFSLLELPWDELRTEEKPIMFKRLQVSSMILTTWVTISDWLEKRANKAFEQTQRAKEEDAGIEHEKPAEWKSFSKINEADKKALFEVLQVLLSPSVLLRYVKGNLTILQSKYRSYLRRDRQRSNLSQLDDSKKSASFPGWEKKNHRKGKTARRSIVQKGKKRPVAKGGDAVGSAPDSYMRESDDPERAFQYCC
ncbi:MAG: hypothetical protein M1836_004394 [Candelina mexicana]|nr:MAG: hypothetical protein M1836_004394 [Candelina mexicana]